MHIYTTKTTAPDVVKPPAFEQRGITRNTQSNISSSTVVGFPTERPPPYSQYKQHVDTFVSATTHGTVLKLGGYYGLGNVTTLLGIPPPTVVFALHNDLQCNEDYPEDKDFIKGIIKYGATVAQTGKHRKVTMTNCPWIPMEQIKELLAMEAPVATNSELNIFFHKSYHLVHKVITAFLATHTYPCFSEEDPNADVDMEDDVTPPWAQVVEVPTSVSITGQDINKYLTDNCNIQKKHQWLLTQDDITIHDKSVFVSVDDVVPVAKPSPLPFTFNVGSTATVPNLPGIVFPYFRGMLLSDKTSLFHYFTRHFKGTLGTNAEEIEEGIEHLRRDLDRGSGTEFHLVMTHLFFMADLALETQTRMFVLISEGYMGCVLLGARFKVFSGLKWVAPESPENLRVSVSELSSHNEAVAAILGLVASILKDGIEEIPAKLAEGSFTSSWSLCEVLNLINFDSVKGAVEEKLLRLVSLTGYRQGYRSIDGDNVLWAMKLLNDLEKPLDPFPVYIPVGKADLLSVVRERRGRVLAAFGSNTFSIISAKGLRVTLPEPYKTPDKNTRALYNIKLDNLPSKSIYFFSKPISIVLSELARLRDGTVASTVVLGVPSKERAVEQRKVHVVRDEEKIVAIWNEYLRYHCPQIVEVGEASNSRKRGPEQEEEAAGRRNKRVGRLADVEF